MSSMYILLCVSWLGFAAALSGPPYALEDAELHFERFIEQHGKHYADKHEKQARFQIFKDNLEEINRMNEKRNEPIFGITKFTDLTIEEFLKYYTGCKQPDTDPRESCSYISGAEITYGAAPESFDWRDSNVVTRVKDQKPCGSCYAFSAVGNIEGQYAIKHGQLLELSEQQIVDCDKRTNGCHGGFGSNVFRTLIETGGIESEVDYPYTNQKEKGTCMFDASKVKVQLSDCHLYNLTSQERVKQLLYQTGPIYISIKGTGLLHFGLTRIISDADCDVGPRNHAVLLVGYGTENGEQYWISKNSWGTDWGDQGYFKMQRGEDALSCGMMNEFMTSSIVV